ncbi:MAG: UDP-N-acetylglucosamine 2-epimerase (non-hydrolyzing) [Myxococcota bacterium]|nr:UDP-N-acetylglucosamine 2-epimerase (non-hydrolyzing) [Myxococcota bacterium]
MESSKIRVLALVGARPNFMKIAPLLRELRARQRFQPTLVHTGQHYDASMSADFFRDLGIPEPDVNLAVGSGSHATQTAQVLVGVEQLLIEQRPEALLLVGDVNSTVAASLAAAKLLIPIAHVEAGLRSGDRSMPEEINRLVTDTLATWCFTTEPAGDANLRREGISEDKIHQVGNVMIDTLRANQAHADELDTLDRLGLESGGYALLTLHRPSNVDDRTTLTGLFEALEEIHREIPVVFPVHPRTSAAIRDLLGGKEPALRLLEPQGYLDFLRLMSQAKFVLTDSGGIQEETTALGVPCLTMRDNTERPITIEEGTNILVGSRADAVRNAARRILDGEAKTGRVPDLWDGRAAVRIADILERDLWPVVEARAAKC